MHRMHSREQNKRTTVLRYDVQLNKAENAWKPTTKESAHSHRGGDVDGDDPEHAQTQELFGRLRSILNKLTPEKFQELMKQVAELRIDTEERLKGATDLICEKAILEPNFATTHANMCHHRQKLKVPTSDQPGIHVEFRRLPQTLLYVFIRSAAESTLDHGIGAQESLLLHHFVKAGTLPTQQYYKGLEETLEAVEEMAIDIPHIWLYLAELITPMLHEGGILMGQLFREISKPLGNAGMLLVQILKLLCKGMTPKTVGALWTEAGLNWIGVHLVYTWCTTENHSAEGESSKSSDFFWRRDFLLSSSSDHGSDGRQLLG